MKKRTDEEIAKSLYDRATKMKYQSDKIKDLEAKLKLRDDVIESQRKVVEALKAELNRKKWWKLW